MDNDEVSGVPQNMPMAQNPQGIFQRPPEKKPKKLTKKQRTQREKKIKWNLDIKLGILPPNTPPKKLTEDEHIEYQQRLVNIKNINISRSTAKAGLGPTTFSTPPMEIPPQYPPMPPNMPIPLSAPVSAGYALGGSGQIIPVPMMRPHQGLIGESEGLLRIMDRADRKSADKPINTPQGQLPAGQADQTAQAMVGDDVERGAGWKWLQQGESSQRGKPMFPDDKYIGPSPMRSKFERDKERMEQEELRQREREKREEQKSRHTGSAYDPFGNIPPSHTRNNPMKGGPSGKEVKLQNEINVLEEELRMGKVVNIVDIGTKRGRISRLKKDIELDRDEWKLKRADAKARREEKDAQKFGRSRSTGSPPRFNIVEERQGGVPAQMNQNPLVIDVEEEDVEPPTSTRDMGRIDRPSEPTFAPPPGMRMNMGGELEPDPTYRMPTIAEAMESLSPSEKADLAWDIATGKTPVASPDTSPRAEAEPQPAPAPPPAVPEERGRSISKEQFTQKQRQQLEREQEKAREYFRVNHHKEGGENLFDGTKGGVNRDLTYYYENRVGLGDDDELQKWEKYKLNGKDETKGPQGQGHKKYMDNKEKWIENKAREPGLTRQVFEYRRALRREKMRKEGTYNKK